MRKPHNRFSQNSVETWHMDGRNKQILVIIRITLHQGRVTAGSGLWLGRVLPYSTWEDVL